MLGLRLAAAFLGLLLAQETDLNTYALKSGQVLTGNVVRVEGETVTLKVTMFGGTAEIQRKLDDFTNDTAYLIASAAGKDTPDDHLRLAQFAAGMQMKNAARKEFRAAYALAEAAKDEPKMKEIEKVAADVVERAFKLALEKGNLTQAKEFLEILVVRLYDQRTDAQRESLVAMLDAATEKVAAARKAAEEARIEKQAAADMARLLKPIDKKLAEAHQANNDGLVAKNRGTAHQNYDNAIEAYREAYRGIISLQKNQPNNRPMQDKLSSMLVQLLDDGIDTCMNAASLLMTQTDFNGAQKYVNLALTVDPKNQKALEMRQEIQQAAATSGRRWW